MEKNQKRQVPQWHELPYNPKLIDRAKALRKAGNLAEVVFWNHVKRKQFLGLDFDRQKIIGNYIVDFYCKKLGIVVEIDGSSHQNKQEYDAIRDTYLEGLGLKVIHIPAKKVLQDIVDLMEALKEEFNLFSPDYSSRQDK